MQTAFVVVMFSNDVFIFYVNISECTRVIFRRDVVSYFVLPLIGINSPVIPPQYRLRMKVAADGCSIDQPKHIHSFERTYI